MRSASMILVVGCVVLLTGCVRYRPDLRDDATYFQRIQTQERDGVVVSVAGLSAPESKKAFGADLAGHGILPLWIRIENRDFAEPLFFLERGMGAAYFTPGEAAYITRVKPGIRFFDRPFLRLLLPVGFIVMPVDHFFVRSANEVMRETFASNALRYGWIH
ncbi:MAG: hypothetical protein KTQ49_08635, partial [Candidatus Omnitrophica bacterium]|nr:hypothetical protein [Candidatus Omnitrophota bacterium]